MDFVSCIHKCCSRNPAFSWQTLLASAREHADTHNPAAGRAESTGSRTSHEQKTDRGVWDLWRATAISKLQIFCTDQKEMAGRFTWSFTRGRDSTLFFSSFSRISESSNWFEFEPKTASCWKAIYNNCNPKQQSMMGGGKKDCIVQGAHCCPHWRRHEICRGGPKKGFKKVRFCLHFCLFLLG